MDATDQSKVMLVIHGVAARVDVGLQGARDGLFFMGWK